MPVQFELTREYIDKLKDALEAGNEVLIKTELEPLHQADLAEILDHLSADEARSLFHLIPGEKRAATLLQLDDEMRETLLRELSVPELGSQISRMDTDDATDIIGELPDDKKQEVLAFVRKDKQRTRDIEDLLAYTEDSAGGLMAKELIKVKPYWTVAQCVREMRKQAEAVSTIYTVYVVDDQNQLLGTLPLKKLLFTPDSVRSTIEDIYIRDVISVNVHQDGEEVAKMMEKYDLVVLPVIDDHNKLLGRITIDDVVDLIMEEAERDYQMASGITERTSTTASVWLLSRARLPWLVIGMIGGILGAQIIEQYEEQIQIYPEMAFFIPLIAAMGGNAGIQSSAIVVQGLASKVIHLQDIYTRLSKELLVGLLNGILCCGIIWSYNMLFGHNTSLALTVGISLLAVIIYASFFGTLIPLILDRYKIDPAVATGPFITTLNDVVGIFLYFLAGRIMYGLF